MSSAAPHRAIRILLLALVALVVLPAGAQAATLGCADDARGTTDLSSWTASMLDATNAHRRALGLVELQLDATLTKASVWKARDLAARNYFAHDDPAQGDAPARSPWTRLTDCGWTGGGSRAENIAAGQRSGADFIQAWLDSPGHRANIENASLRYVGFGVASLDTSTYDTYAVQMFSSIAGPAGTITPPPTPPVTGGGDTSGDDTGGDDRDPTELEVTWTLRGSTVRIEHVRCRMRQAVRGWCWRARVTAKLASTDGTPIAGTRVLAAGGRAAAAGTTDATGTATFLVNLRPPARGTGAWLDRVAKVWTLDAGATTARVRAAR